MRQKLTCLPALALVASTALLCAGVASQPAGAALTAARAASYKSTELPLPTPNNGLTASDLPVTAPIACPAAHACRGAESYYRHNTMIDVALQAEQRGTWHATKAPLPHGASTKNQQVSVNSVACWSRRHCVAVGSYAEPSRGMPLIETWSDGAWKATRGPVPAKNRKVSGGSLSDVVCAAPGKCVAVGDYITYHGLGLIETLRHGRWTAHRAALPGGAGHRDWNLTGVACPKASRCYAVGSYDAPSRTDAPLVLTSSGTSWQPRELPGRVDKNHAVDPLAVACASGTHCSAIAAADDNGTTLADVVYATKNGRDWAEKRAPAVTSQVPSGDTPGDRFLTGIACTAGSRCEAVGYEYYDDSSGGVDGQIPLLVAIHGRAVSSEAAGEPADGAASPYAELWAVSCASSGPCTAGGDYETSDNHEVPLVETGGSPEAVAIPGNGVNSPNASAPALVASMACTAGGWCGGLGSYALRNSGNAAGLAIAP